VSAAVAKPTESRRVKNSDFTVSEDMEKEAASEWYVQVEACVLVFHVPYLRVCVVTYTCVYRERDARKKSSIHTRAPQRCFVLRRLFMESRDCSETGSNKWRREREIDHWGSQFG